MNKLKFLILILTSTFLIVCSAPKPTPQEKTADIDMELVMEYNYVIDKVKETKCNQPPNRITKTGESVLHGKKESMVPGVCRGNCQDGIGQLVYPSGSFLRGQFSNGELKEGFKFVCNYELFEGTFNSNWQLVQGKKYKLDPKTFGIVSLAEGRFKEESLESGKWSGKSENQEDLAESEDWEESGSFNKKNELVNGIRKTRTQNWEKISTGLFKNDDLHDGEYKYKDSDGETVYKCEKGKCIQQSDIFLFRVLPPEQYFPRAL